MTKKKFLLGLLLVPSLLLSACSFDLGSAFEKSDNYKTYYDSFADVRAKYDAGLGEGAEDTYNIKNSLFNDYTVNNMTWEKDEYKVAERQYVYIIVTFKQVLKVESLSLYFKATEVNRSRISAFYYVSDDLAPKKIMYLSSPTEDPETDPPTPIIYDDPLIPDANVSFEVGFEKDAWKSVTFDKFRQEGYTDGYLHTGSNSVLYIRVENNSGRDRGTTEPVNFSFINLLVRAIE